MREKRKKQKAISFPIFFSEREMRENEREVALPLITVQNCDENKHINKQGNK